jgi:hypothetical protein
MATNAGQAFIFDIGLENFHMKSLLVKFKSN